VSGLQHLRMDGTPWPAVGAAKRTTYGGVSGNAVRPIALKAISSIANKIPGFPIMATGGADSADSCIQFIYAGAPVVQVSSAIQNQDFSIVQDWIMGLKWHLYSRGRKDLCQWEQQQPPAPAGLNALVTGSLPRFGEYQHQRWEEETRACQALEKSEPGDFSAPSRVPVGPIPRVNDLVGIALKGIGSFGELLSLAPHNQSVAMVNDDLCINCGKCMMTCNDTGYQAIRFDGARHQPFITDSCTGCTLCVSVCPVPDCITMVNRDATTRPAMPTYNPSRGIPYGEQEVPMSTKKVEVGQGRGVIPAVEVGQKITLAP